MAETGQAGQAVTDEAVLAFAKVEGRAVLTLNRKHFVRLHCTDPEHAGIVVCTFDPDFIALARRIDEALSSVGSLAGQ